jgi:hypothetical protein
MIIVPASSANALRVVRGGAKTRVPGRRIHPVAFELEHGVASQHEEELLV